MKTKKIVFFTGAGISAESGISTFRDTGGLWEQYKIEDIGTSGNVINVQYLIDGAKYSMLNNLEYSDAIDDNLFDKVIYDKATVAIDEIEVIVEELLE